MRIIIDNHNVKIWLSKNDTYNWANMPGQSWPCSQLANKSLFAEIEQGDLIDYAITPKTLNSDIDTTEFNAILQDFINPELPENHCCRMS